MNLGPRHVELKDFVSLCTGVSLLFSAGIGLSSPVRAAAFESGLKLYHSGVYPLAIQFFKQALVTQKDNPYVHYYLADSLAKTHQIYEAQWEYQHIVAMAPESQAARLSQIGLLKLKRYNEVVSKELFNPAETSSSSVTGTIAAALPTVPSVPAAPSAPDMAPDTSPDLLTGFGDDKKDNYLNEVYENGSLARWSTRSPIKVYIEKSPPGIRNFEQTFITQIRRALDAWMKALGNRISYVLLDTPAQADIRVTWVNTIDTRGHTTESGTTYTAGVTVPVIERDRLQLMDVKLGTLDIRQRPQSVNEIYLVSLHELGHALGLRGHSQDKNDIMYAQNQNVGALSQRDINTIRLLYGQEVDITNLPPKVKNQDPEQAKRFAGKLDEEIQKMENLVHENGSSLNYNNLGSTYYQKGKLLTKAAGGQMGDGSDEKNGRYWFDKAMSSFDKAIKLEPEDASLYFNECVVHKEMGNFEAAHQDVESAMRYDTRENKYYLEKALILTRLKRKAEALSALNDYVVRDPENASSETVQKARRIITNLP